jgi:hypothetical protein
MAQQYKKNPVIIEAVTAKEALASAAKDWDALPGWLSRAYEAGGIVFAADHVSITTLEGTMRADPDDYIIQGIEGELYPCKPDIFHKTYTPVK